MENQDNQEEEKVQQMESEDEDEEQVSREEGIRENEEEDSDMEEYQGGKRAMEEEVDEQDEPEQNLEEELPEDLKSDSEYKVTEIQIEDDSKIRLSMGVEDCFSEKSEQQKKKQQSEQNTKVPETLVNYASVKQTIKRKERKNLQSTSQSVKLAAKEIESKIAHIPPRYTPVPIGSSKKQEISNSDQKLIEKKSNKKPRVPSFRNTTTRKSRISDILPNPIGGEKYAKNIVQKKYKRPATAQERKIEQKKKQQREYLNKTHKLNSDLKDILGKPKVEKQEFKQMINKAERHLDKGKIMEKRRILEVEAAKQREVKQLLIQQDKQQRKAFLRPQSAKVVKKDHTRIIEKDGKYTQDVSKLTNATDYLDIALKQKRRKSHAVSVKAIKAVTAVEEVVKATRRNKSSLSPLYQVLQKREKNEKSNIMSTLKERGVLKVEEPKKYQKPKFAIEMERKRKKQMDELRNMARQKLMELRIKSKIKDEDDALDVLDRVTRVAKRKQKVDALPAQAREVHDQEALLEQILELKKNLNQKLKVQRKVENQIKESEVEAEKLQSQMRKLALSKAVVDVGTKRYEKIQPTLLMEKRKKSIITTESPLKSKRYSQEQITPIEKLGYFLDRQRLTGVQAFGFLDSNNDGVLTVSQIREGLIQKLGVPIRGEELRQLIKSIDVDGDGVLTKHQFTSVLENQGTLGVKRGRRVAKDVNVENPLDIEEMLLDLKVKIKYMREKLPELKNLNSFQDPELKVMAKTILSLQTEIQNQKYKFSAQKRALIAKIAASSPKQELFQKLLTLRVLAQQTRQEQSSQIGELEKEQEQLKQENSQLMQINLLLKGSKSELKDQLRYLQIRQKMSRELNIDLTRVLRGFVQRSELDFKQLFDIQDKQIIEVNYQQEEQYRRKAVEFLAEGFITQKRMAVNTLKGLRCKAALWTLKDYYHEKWEMKRNKAERLLRAVSFLVFKGVQLKEQRDQKKRVREREKRKQEQNELKNTPKYKAAELIATTWKQKKLIQQQRTLKISPRKLKVVYKQLEVMCSQCSKKAALECVECAKPFCESCYDSGHRSGFRRQHEFKNIIGKQFQTLVRRKKKIEEQKEEESPSLFSKPLKSYSDQEFMKEFQKILRELKLDIQEIINSKIDKEEMEQEGRSDIITTAQLYTAIRLTVHQLKEPEILKYINLVYKDCSWHPQIGSQWRYFIDCQKLYSAKRQN